jgi:AI-2 transport protein TqsA
MASLPAPTRTLVFLAASAVVLAGMHAAQGILAPLVLAAVLVIIVHPVRHPLERRGWPRAAATSAVIAIVYLILVVLVAMLVFAGVRFSALVTDYLPELRAQVADVTGWLASIGLDDGSVDEVSAALDPAQLISLVSSVSGAVTGILGTLFIVLTYAFFMAIDAGRYDSARRLFGAERDDVLTRVTSLDIGVRRYFVVSASFGAIVAVIDGFALWALGIPAPAVWAILAFVTNFIPNIGFVIGVIPPTVLGLVIGGWPLALGVIAIYSAVNVVLQVLIQPKFVADAVKITLTLSTVSVLFWTLVIGPLGAILAVPLTLLARAVLLPTGPDRAWWSWLSGEDAAPPPAPLPAAPTLAPTPTARRETDAS